MNTKELIKLLKKFLFSVKCPKGFTNKVMKKLKGGTND